MTVTIKTAENKTSIIVFVDGASSGNPGPGGWGAIIVFPDGTVQELGGRETLTTNNRMELMAAIDALDNIPKNNTPIEIYGDSTYVIRGITQWIWGWRKKNWMTADGKEVSNAELWKRLASLARERKIQWHYVRGHSGIPGNERADDIAVNFSQNKKVALYQGSILKYSIPIYDIPENTSLPPMKPRENFEKAKPFSYLSVVGQVPMRHSNWKDCEQRIKGQSGARFKKAMNVEEEIEILGSWGFKPEDL